MVNSPSGKILVGDVAGTNVRFGLAHRDGDGQIYTRFEYVKSIPVRVLQKSAAALYGVAALYREDNNGQ